MSATTRAACVIGWPVAHSRSPLIHGYWLRRYRIDGVYRREAVRPEDFPGFIRTLAERGYAGANVTLPHKEAALTLSVPDEGARAVGAANTLWFEDDRLMSTNTDVEGFLRGLDEAAPAWDQGREKAVVIGAGGAARAIVHALIGRGIPRIHVVNRTLARAQDLARRFGPAVAATPWDDLPRALEGAGLLANASSLGMAGQPDLHVALSPLRADAVVADAVYTPLRTALVAAAEAHGLRVADGLGMLLHQAGRGFERWFGVAPEVTADLRALVEAELTAPVPAPASAPGAGGE